ncbi:hypothetical protein EMCRGX_G024590 [Ephydatia muelleri]
MVDQPSCSDKWDSTCRSQVLCEDVLALFHELGPPLVNIHNCEVFSHSSLDIFSAGVKNSNNPNIKILGSPIGDAEFCHQFINHKRSEAKPPFKACGCWLG